MTLLFPMLASQALPTDSFLIAEFDFGGRWGDQLPLRSNDAILQLLWNARSAGIGLDTCYVKA